MHNQAPLQLSHRFSVAPMMDWTDRHCRYFLRQLSRHALLYSEMVTTGALLHGDTQRFLAYHADEHPVALQLGGSQPDELAKCARLVEEWGYDEVNLNAGCPSDRVQNNMIGACLMGHPQLVADCVKAMQDAGKPVRPGDVAKALDADSKEVSKAIDELKKSGKIMSPKRCYYAPAE